MFHHIPARIQSRMRELERIDAADRTDGTQQQARLRQVPEKTGRLLAVLAACAPRGRFLEIGTSGGYSALWISLACQEKGTRLTTFEILPDKARIGRATFEAAGVESIVQLIQGDAREHPAEFANVAFCFLDAEKDVYTDCYKLVVPGLVHGGLLVADNVTSHREALQGFLQFAAGDDRVDSILVPIGNGLLICRRDVSPQGVPDAAALEERDS